MLSLETLQNIFEIKIFECLRSSTVLLIPNILITENRETVFQFLPAKAASSSLSDPYCNAMVIADKRSPWADLLLLQKRKKKYKIKKKKKEEVIMLTINSHPERVSKQVKLMTVAYTIRNTDVTMQEKTGTLNKRNC